MPLLLRWTATGTPGRYQPRLLLPTFDGIGRSLIRAVVTTQWGSVRCPTAAGSIGSQSPLLLSLVNTSVCVLLLLLLLPK